MRKLLLFSTLITFSTTFIFAQDTLNDWKKENLIGKVKSLERIRYKGVEKFGEIEKEKKQYSTKSEFNKDGYLKLHEFESARDDVKNSAFYKYDEKNRIVEEKGVEGGETFISKVLFNTDDKIGEINTYDKKGKLLGKEKRKYYSTGTLAEVLSYDADGKLVEKEEYDYCMWMGMGFWKRRINEQDNEEENWIFPLGNANEKPAVVKHFEGEATNKSEEVMIGSMAIIECLIAPKYPKSTVMTIKYFKYDDQGRVTEEERFEEKGGKQVNVTTKKFTYDKSGNIIREKVTDTNFTTYTYTYDGKGNWIRQVETSHIGTSVFHYVTERVIKYF